MLESAWTCRWMEKFRFHTSRLLFRTDFFYWNQKKTNQVHVCRSAFAAAYVSSFSHSFWCLRHSFHVWQTVSYVVNHLHHFSWCETPESTRLCKFTAHFTHILRIPCILVFPKLLQLFDAPYWAKSTGASHAHFNNDAVISTLSWKPASFIEPKLVSCCFFFFCHFEQCDIDSGLNQCDIKPAATIQNQSQSNKHLIL